MTLPFRRIVKVACWLFILIAALNAALMFRSYLAFENFIEEFGYSCNPCYHYGDEVVRSILLATAMAVLMLIGKRRRSLPLRIVGSVLFVVLLIQSFVAFRFAFEVAGNHGSDDVYWQLVLVGSALLILLGLAGGTGLLLNVFRNRADAERIK